jgi:hypothetical protein
LKSARQDKSAKDVIVGKNENEEVVGGGGDRIIAAVLRGPSRLHIVKVKRHDDAVLEDNSEELTKEEEELANKEEEEEEAKLKQQAKHTAAMSAGMHGVHHHVPLPPDPSVLPPGELHSCHLFVCTLPLEK